jgi:hypothetical protein
MLEITAPNSTEKTEGLVIYLCGSINSGLAQDWQGELIKAFKDYKVTFLNPRRPDWDINEKKTIDNPYYIEQLDWEDNQLHDSDLVIVYFQPDLPNPGVAMDFGIIANSNHDMIVCCPEGYKYRAKVQYICEGAGVICTESFEELVKTIDDYINLRV